MIWTFKDLGPREQKVQRLSSKIILGVQNKTKKKALETGP